MLEVLPSQHTGRVQHDGSYNIEWNGSGEGRDHCDHRNCEFLEWDHMSGVVLSEDFFVHAHQVTFQLLLIFLVFSQTSCPNVFIVLGGIVPSARMQGMFAAIISLNGG